jgi:hypothetical protein
MNGAPLAFVALSGYFITKSLKNRVVLLFIDPVSIMAR